MAQQGTAEAGEKKAIPLVAYLKLPENPGEEPYLWGSRCKGCGSVYLGPRVACSKCLSTELLEEVRLGDTGEVWVYSVVYQSVPGVQAPYIAAIVDLPEGVSVRANIEGVEPKPESLHFGMKVKMFTEKVRVDQDGNDIIAYKFRPLES
ncbi:MAG: Zn-ribbon domain-containing OB-fold protein [Dehalococcoidia bacterium]